MPSISPRPSTTNLKIPSAGDGAPYAILELKSIAPEKWVLSAIYEDMRAYLRRLQTFGLGLYRGTVATWEDKPVFIVYK